MVKNYIIILVDAASIAGGIKGRLKDIFSRIRCPYLLHQNVDHVIIINIAVMN
jgi:hypothetical protein